MGRPDRLGPPPSAAVPGNGGRPPRPPPPAPIPAPHRPCPPPPPRRPIPAPAAPRPSAPLLHSGRPPLLRLLAMARPLRGRLLLAVAAGAAATGCGVALLAVSGFLLARASQHPSIVAISVAVVAVRALSIGRGVSRYLGRRAPPGAGFRGPGQGRVASRPPA